MANINIVTNVLGPCAANCYTVFNQETREAVIIDPADRGDFIIKQCEEQKYKPVAIFLTHGHFDHIGAVSALRKAYPDIKVYAGKAEEDILKNPMLNLSEMFGSTLSEYADIYVDDDEDINLLGVIIKCINVPGHTKGGTCFYFAGSKLLFSGDTLFCGSVGRSDFPTGDAHALIENIEKKLFTLPDDVIVYPGHDSRTTIKREKEYNPFFM